MSVWGAAQSGGNRHPFVFGGGIRNQISIHELPLNLATTSLRSLLLLQGLKRFDVKKLLDYRGQNLFTIKTEIEKRIRSEKFLKIEDFVDVRDRNFAASASWACGSFWGEP